MNHAAEKHLANAAHYLAQGDAFYRKAKPEMDAAYAAGATQQEIADYLALHGTVQRSRKWVGEVLAWDGKGTLYGHDTEDRQTRQAKQVLRESTPEQVAEIVASLPAEAVAKVSKAVTSHYEERHQKARAEASARLREELGDNLADGLIEEQRLRDAEAEAFTARRSLRTMLSHLNAAELDQMPAAWREDFLKTLDDLSQRIEIAKSLLSGTLDEDIEAFLAEAGQ